MMVVVSKDNFSVQLYIPAWVSYPLELMFLPCWYGWPDLWRPWPCPLCISLPCPSPLFHVSFPIDVSLDMFRRCGFLYCAPIAVFMNDGSSAGGMSLKRIVAFCKVWFFWKTYGFSFCLVPWHAKIMKHSLYWGFTFILKSNKLLPYSLCIMHFTTLQF